MTKIESRPVKGKQWEYRFFVDFDGSLEDAAVKNALRGLREEATNLRNSLKLLDIRIDRKSRIQSRWAKAPEDLLERGYLECVQTN